MWKAPHVNQSLDCNPNASLAVMHSCSQRAQLQVHICSCLDDEVQLDSVHAFSVEILLRACTDRIGGSLVFLYNGHKTIVKK